MELSAVVLGLLLVQASDNVTANVPPPTCWERVDAVRAAWQAEHDDMFWNPGYVLIGYHAGDAITIPKRDPYQTQLGRYGAITWENSDNGPDKWTPTIMFVWWDDDSGGVMINRRTGEVKRCGPPGKSKVVCMPFTREPGGGG